MRVTLKYIKEFAETEVNLIDSKLSVTDIYRTNYSLDQYECGAARLIIKLEKPEGLLPIYIYVFYTCKAIESEIKSGKRLVLKLRDGKYLSGASLEIINT